MQASSSTTQEKPKPIFRRLLRRAVIRKNEKEESTKQNAVTGFDICPPGIQGFTQNASNSHTASWNRPMQQTIATSTAAALLYLLISFSMDTLKQFPVQ